jgi:glutamate receptor, ionotropic, invertebrate
VTTDLMQTIMEIARDLKMVDTFAQWFYVVSDTNYIRNNISSITSLIEEGNNIAFIYNYTRGENDCTSGVKCLCNELLRSFVLGLSRAIREEMAVYGQISDEEWEIIRPSKKERRDSILSFMTDYLKKTSKCGNCTMWKVETADIWGSRYESMETFLSQTAADKRIMQDISSNFKLIHNGMWRPLEGLSMTDALFPHISHGFRGRTFHIVTYNVSLT